MCSYLSLIKGLKVLLCMYHLASLFSFFLLSFLKSDVTPSVSDLYAHIGQDAYQHSVIAVAVKGMLVEQILFEIGHKHDKDIA